MTGVQTCALPISVGPQRLATGAPPASASATSTRIQRHTRNMTEMFPGTDGKPPGYDSYNDPSQDNTGPRKKSGAAALALALDILAGAGVAVFVFCLF